MQRSGDVKGHGRMNWVQEEEEEELKNKTEKEERTPNASSYGSIRLLGMRSNTILFH